MDDVQLYQIFWSFMIVYIVALWFYGIFLVLSVYYERYYTIKITFRILMFILLYQLVEIILRRYDVLLIFMRLILTLLVKKWMILYLRIMDAILRNPAYADVVIDLRIILSNNN